MNKKLFKKILLILSLLSTYSFSESYSFTQKVKVEHYQPVYNIVEQKNPYKTCYVKKVKIPGNTIIYDENYDRMHDDQVAGSIVGGVIGGVLGNQIGKGTGKKVATVGGAVLGSIIGNNAASNTHKPKFLRMPDRYKYENICETHYKTERKRLLSGYYNIAHFKGRILKKFSNRKLKYITLHVNVNY